MNEGELEQALLALLEARGPEKTACPSEVARAVDPDDWRPWMEPVRAVARRLAAEGRVRVLQKGEEVDPEGARGPIRLQIVG